MEVPILEMHKLRAVQELCLDRTVDEVGLKGLSSASCEFWPPGALITDVLRS